MPPTFFKAASECANKPRAVDRITIADVCLNAQVFHDQKRRVEEQSLRKTKNSLKPIA
jgi:hypothetical protein